MFSLNQIGCKKADCPTLAGGTMRAPALVSLRIIDGRLSNAKGPVVTSRVFQLTITDNKETLDVVIDMYLVFILFVTTSTFG